MAFTRYKPDGTTPNLPQIWVAQQILEGDRWQSNFIIRYNLLMFVVNKTHKQGVEKLRDRF
jgi:hypothetical protein